MGLELPLFTVQGTPHQMGLAYGIQCRDMISAFVADRVTAVETYLRERGHLGTDPLFECGAACLELVRDFDPNGYIEHMGIAEGAGIDPVKLFTTTNMTDVRDIILLPSDPLVSEDEGCTAALLPPSISANGHSLQGQTWDLNGPDVEYVIALQRLPDEGPETLSVTCAGCQSLMGMNQHGITVGTTNLKTRGAKVGIPYLSVLHKALNQTSFQEASRVVEAAPVASAHSYFIGSADGAIEWEKTAHSSHARSTRDGALVRTNHCLVEGNIALEEDLSPSTYQRYQRMQALLGASDQHTVSTLKALFTDRADGRLSINRFAEDNSGATTNAVVAFNPAELEFWACRGQANRGVWTQLEFERRVG
ncbi:C45 family autoproteolytic acyltransferase/hydolase [Maricaulis sp. MIT060901]|uniref:C45 family autoproteolytic acyltransferase/hydolase n=1 Tax=Maricaulis sp. MIT060901 TaxID=3096993 RepID=UPI003999C7F7